MTILLSLPIFYELPGYEKKIWKIKNLCKYEIKSSFQPNLNHVNLSKSLSRRIFRRDTPQDCLSVRKITILGKQWCSWQQFLDLFNFLNLISNFNQSYQISDTTNKNYNFSEYSTINASKFITWVSKTFFGSLTI